MKKADRFKRANTGEGRERRRKTQGGAGTEDSIAQS